MFIYHLIFSFKNFVGNFWKFWKDYISLWKAENTLCLFHKKTKKCEFFVAKWKKRYRVKKVLQKMILLGYPTSIREQTKRTPKRVLKKAIVKVVFSSCFWFSCSWRLADSWCSERTPGTSLAVSVPDFMHLIKVLKIFSLLVVFYYQVSEPPPTTL